MDSWVKLGIPWLQARETRTSPCSELLSLPSCYTSSGDVEGGYLPKARGELELAGSFAMGPIWWD